jgi:polar amino acid transport system substrate-binding protein
MKVRIAYLEEPPFYWTAEDRTVTGSDIELAEIVLKAIGVSSIEYHLTTFDELLPGVQEGRWDMNVPIFVTDERSERVTFSSPVWALGDGFLVQTGNAKSLVSYQAVGERKDAKLATIAGQVQIDSARAAGVAEEQIVIFRDQAEAIDALLNGTVDAYASTALGNRVLSKSYDKLEAVAHPTGNDGTAPVGAFSFNKANLSLLQAVNDQLRLYLGSTDHRARMAKYGLTATEIDSVVADKK